MCGIAGIVMRGNVQARGEPRETIRQMLDVIGHRGPDGQGMFEGPGVWLGHRRLSIIDLDGGAQPLFNENQSIALVFNGELYGYRHLRNNLISRHQFSTETDAEVLLHLYEEVGDDVESQVDGMYAYAMHDGHRLETRLAVDPFAIKPLYYYLDNEILIFCSEMRGIQSAMRSMAISQSIDSDAASVYLRQGWIPAPHTLLHGVKKFLPGEVIVVLENGQVRHRVVPPLSREVDLENVASLDEVETVLCKVVAEQLVADVDVGLFLSGGIDSSVLAALAARGGAHLKTFTARFVGSGAEGERANEADIARAVASLLGTDHHEFTVTSTAMMSGLDACLEALDEPIVDPATLPLLSLCRLARDSVKVCLAGDGGDEMFGGYSRHWLASYRKHFQVLPSWIQSLGIGLPRALGRIPIPKLQRHARRLQSFGSVLAEPGYVPGPFSHQFESLLGPTARAIVTASDHGRRLGSVICEDLEGQLAGQLLPKTDRMSMWTSLEVRVPYVDRRVLDVAARVPWNQKIRGRQTKVVLRNLASRFLPEEIAQRPKHGFRVPLSAWLRNELLETVHTRLLDDYRIEENVFPLSSCRQIVNAHASGAQEHGIRIWAVFVLNDWLRRNAFDISDWRDSPKPDEHSK